MGGLETTRLLLASNDVLPGGVGGGSDQLGRYYMSHLAAAHGRPTVGIYCDHEPGLAGLIGSGPVVSLGGKGLMPSVDEVQSALNTVLTAQR